MRKLLQFGLYTGLILASCCASLAISEAIFRIFDPLGIFYQFEASRYFKVMKKTSFGYIHKPGTSDSFQKVRVRINSEGFRGADFNIHKTQNAFRVMLLGDSVVFGWGVKEEDTLAPRLTALLKPPAEKHLEVLPIGVGSWNTRVQYEFMKERGFSYEPDLIVWIIVDNDIQAKPPLEVDPDSIATYDQLHFTPHWFDSRTLPIRRWVADYSYLWSTVERFIRVDAVTKQLHQYYYDHLSPQHEDARLAAEKLLKNISLRDIPVVAFLHGSKESELEKVYSAFYGAILKKHRVPLHRFPEAMYELKHRNSVIDSHQNSEGLRIMAENIRRVVQSLILHYNRKSESP